MNFDGVTSRLDLNFYNTVSCFLPNSNTDWQPNQVTIAKLHSAAFVTVVCQDLQPAPIKLASVYLTALLLHL